MKPRDFNYHFKLTLPTLAVLLVAAVQHERLGKLEPDGKLELALNVMGRTGLSARDEGEMTAGYYEGLLDGAQNTASKSRGLLANLSALKQAPPDWKDFAQTTAAMHVGGYIQYEIAPNDRIEHAGVLFVSNQWGQRDKDYTKARPAGVRRLALVGSSIGVGSGVLMEKTYEALLEDQLNSAPVCAGAPPIEIINFSVPGYQITQLLDVAVDRAPSFEPNVVLLEINVLIAFPNWANHIAALVQKGEDLKYDFLKRFAEEANLSATDSTSRISTKLAMHRIAITEACVSEAQRRLKEKGIELVLLAIPFTATREELHPMIYEILDRVKPLGLPVISSVDAYGTLGLEELRIRDYDNHPNELGHRLMFEAMNKGIREDPRLRRIVAGCE